MTAKTAHEVLEDANRGIVGIDRELEVFGGYDQQVYEASLDDELTDCRDVKNLPKSEKVALADAMIERWQRYRERAAAAPQEERTDA